VPLVSLRGDARFTASTLLRQGRLSVVPLSEPEWTALLALGA